MARRSPSASTTFLFIVPLDVTAISGARSLGQLALLPGGIFKYPDLTQGQTIKQVRWQKNGKRIAVDSITPTATGQTIDNIVIYDLTSCTSANPMRWYPLFSRPGI